LFRAADYRSKPANLFTDLIRYICQFALHQQKEEILKSVVCVKQVPDSAAKVTAENGRVTWGESPLVINPWDEYAVEAALVQQEAEGGSVTVISVGGESAKDALKHALAMGCSDAILISDPDLAGADTLMTSHVLAAAIRKLGENEAIDLAFFGKQAIDGDMGLTGSQTGRVLGWPVLSLVSTVRSLDLATRKIVVERTIEEGRQTIEADLPAVISVIKDIGEPRYPSFMGIRKAQRAVIPTWSLADLGLAELKPSVRWPEIMNPPMKEVKCEIITGPSAREIAEMLADKILGEKVL
jgi:electron transfer flavoprotein beta subunit